MLTLAQRADMFNAALPKGQEAARLHVAQEQGHDVLYGRWLGGQDYRNRSRYYGATPHGYLQRMAVLFSDVPRSTVFRGRRFPSTLHAFSGSLPRGWHARLDLHRRFAGGGQWFRQGSVYDAGRVFAGWPGFRLLHADPPYSAQDAERYGTAGCHRLRATAALRRVAAPGAFLVWLDTAWPQHRKSDWVTVGRIVLTRSTNHRTRDVSIFQRQP